jgi:iron complex transport system substrate-binding protein
MKRRFTALAAAGVLVWSLAACGDDGASTATTAAPAATTAPVADTAAPDTTPAPDTSVMGPVPERIVSLSPTATEMLFAIGAGDQVVAVDEMSNHPAEALAKSTALSGYTPNVEAIAAYEPDLVVHDGSTDLGAQLDSLGIANWVGAAAMTFDDIYLQIEQLGATTGHVDEAAALVARMRASIEQAVASAPKLDKPPRYYHELDPTYFSVTSNTFIGEVYGLFGLRNIADTTEGTTDYPQLSEEFIISQSPDLIFLADSKCCGESRDSVAQRPGWAATSAVSTGSVFIIDDDIASRWGPRVVDYVELVADAMAYVADLSAG